MRLRILQQLVLLALPLTLSMHAQDSQPYTLRTQSNVVLVPATVQTKYGEMIYALKQEQFVVEDNGVPQTIRLDEDTDSLGLTMVVLVQ